MATAAQRKAEREAAEAAGEGQDDHRDSGPAIEAYRNAIVASEAETDREAFIPLGENAPRITMPRTAHYYCTACGAPDHFIKEVQE